MSYHNTLYDAMLSHAMPYTFIFGLGASTWPKASEPWAGEGGPEQAPQPWPGALRLWARCQHPNQKPAPSSAQGSEALGQVLAPKPKISVYGIAWLSIASYSVVWYDII